MHDTEPTAASVTLAQVQAAAKRLVGVTARTPVERSERLSAQHGVEVFLKREDLQAVRSYKIRGAYNLMAQLTQVEREAGIVCASAGNHAQGVASACRALGIDGVIYLPRTTPRQKRDRIRAHGGDHVELRMVGDTFDEAAVAAAEHAIRRGSVPVPPFDDPRTVAGQGTVALEFLEQLPAVPDVVVVPVGGGGLISGVVTVLDQLAPTTRVVAAEPAGAMSLAAALKAGGPVRLTEIDPFVDGAAVRQIGALPYRLLSNRKLETVAVDEGAICTSMLGLYQNEGVIAEPAGALSVAALDVLQLDPGSTVLCILTGGNNDVSRYGEVLERSLVHEGFRHYFLVDFPQEPGALRRFLDEVLGPDDDITLFEYVKRNNRETGPAVVGVELGSPAGLAGLLDRMAAGPMQVERIEPGSPAYRFLT